MKKFDKTDWLSLWISLLGFGLSLNSTMDLIARW